MKTKHSKSSTKVIVGLSGGVDSAVSAYLLKQQGYCVHAVYMQNWEADFDDPHCTAQQDMTDARAVADHLDIPFTVINFAKEYWNHVFERCLDELAAGRTPNPDIWCNKEIKFNVFLNYALQNNAHFIATGHYAKVSKNHLNEFELHKPTDSNKDQTYFLYTLNQKALRHTLFPLADLTKPEVRKIAKDISLPNSTKKDSTGICFIGERKFKTFLEEYLLHRPGAIVSTEGVNLGKHDGLMYHTLGQRKGLNIGGRQDSSDAPWYVVDKNPKTNELIVGQGHDHPRLFSQHLLCTDIHWIRSRPHLPLNCTAKIRYRQNEQSCTIMPATDNTDILSVTFNEPQRAITPGQSIVFYCHHECLGGAIIT